MESEWATMPLIAAMNALSALSKFQRMHGEKEPLQTQDKQLYAWLALGVAITMEKWKACRQMDIAHVELLRCLGIDILKPKRGMSKNKSSFKFWKPVVKSFEKQMPQRQKNNLQVLLTYLKDTTKDDLDNKFTSVTDHTIQKLQVG
jgi:hypothetical protein